jgi:phenylacetate-CoA ligase
MITACSDIPYWNPKNETMPRAALRALQLAKLGRLCEWAAARSPFHRRRFAAARFTPAQLRTLDDIRRIPIMTREEWMESQAEAPPYGDLLAASPTSAIRYHITSGSSGRTPIRVLDSTRDWEWGAEMWGYALWATGIRPTDVVYFAFGYGSFIGFWGAHYGCEKIGALVIPGGAQSTANRVRQIVETGATTVLTTPTYALRLAQEAAELGVDLARQSRVDKLIVSGEPGGSIASVKRRLEAAWGARCLDVAGMTEIGTVVMYECAERPGGMHVIEDNVLEETLHPETGEPVGYEERAERVVTSFGRGFIPLIRYRTRDMVVKVPHTRCTCGRNTDIYAGGILGRWDDMKLVRGTNVYQRSVEQIVREYDAIDEFQIRLWRKDDLRDEITVRVEVKAEREPEWEGLRESLAAALGAAHEGLRFDVEAVPRGSLPRFELKAKRLVDERGATAPRGSDREEP